MAERPSDETLRAIADGVLAERSTHEALARELLLAREALGKVRRFRDNGGVTHARLFIGIREKMHPDGIAAFDEETNAILDALQRYDEGRHG